MKTLWTLSASLLILSLFSGCSTARKIVLRPGQGGIVAIEHSDAPRGKANSIMNDVCDGKKVKIIEERESVTGNVVEKITNKAALLSTSAEPQLNTSSGKESREETFASRNEWRISFQCE